MLQRNGKSNPSTNFRPIILPWNHGDVQSSYPHSDSASFHGHRWTIWHLPGRSLKTSLPSNENQKTRLVCTSSVVFIHWNLKILENNNNGTWLPKPNPTPTPHGLHDTKYSTFWTIFTRWHPRRYLTMTSMPIWNEMPNNKQNRTLNQKIKNHGNLGPPTTSTGTNILIKNCSHQKMPRITIQRVLCKGGSDIPALLKATGVPDFTCCWLLFWGMCNDSNCKLKHNPITLSKEAIDKAVALLKPGCDKISMQTLNNWLCQEEREAPNPNKTTQTSKPTRQTSDNQTQIQQEWQKV